MPKGGKTPPADLNEAVKSDPDGVISSSENDAESEPEKNLAAVALGRLRALKGGKARTKKISAKRRSEIAKKAANAWWSDKVRDAD